MSIRQEFKEFALKGNVVDLAVGVIIGAAFGKITTSLVQDVFNPLLGLLTGNIDLSKKVVVLREATETVEAVTLNYGAFINAIIYFMLIALVMFSVVKVMNRLRREQDEAPPEKKPAPPPKQEVLLTEIRDLLKERVK